MSIAEIALLYVGRPYIWGGDGSGRCFGGFDCSGIVVECLKACGKISKDYTADDLYNHLSINGWHDVQRNYKAGDIVFFKPKGKKRITHCGIVINDYQMIEAGGGNSNCKSLETSTGMVRIRPIFYRSDVFNVIRNG